MKVKFYFMGEFLPNTKIERTEDREIGLLPRKGEVIAWHRPSGSAVYEVMSVSYVYEDRPEYEGKSYGGDKVCIRIGRVRKSHENGMLPSILADRSQRRIRRTGAPNVPFPYRER